jgi:hypothetical protein
MSTEAGAACLRGNQHAVQRLANGQPAFMSSVLKDLYLPNSLTPVLRFVLKVLLGLLAALFAVSVLAVALAMVLLSLVKSLLTWRKPPFVEMFGQFRRFRSQASWRGFQPGGQAKQRRPGEVVDVEVREIQHDRHLP